MKEKIHGVYLGYTPLEINGQIMVVLNAPDPAYHYADRFVDGPGPYSYDIALEACTKYPTLEQDAPYWKERIGQQVEVEIKMDKYKTGIVDGPYEEEVYEEPYAIPPQQKQDDGDLWDEAEESIERDFGIPIKNLTGAAVIFYLKQHYQLIKRK